MKKKTKTREIKLPMRFNPGTQKYEQVLPLKKSNKKLKIDSDWRGIITVTILLIILLTIFFTALKNYLP